jgi:hypothetical protein
MNEGPRAESQTTVAMNQLNDVLTTNRSLIEELMERLHPVLRDSDLSENKCAEAPNWVALASNIYAITCGLEGSNEKLRNIIDRLEV